MMKILKTTRRCDCQVCVVCEEPIHPDKTFFEEVPTSDLGMAIEKANDGVYPVSAFRGYA